MKNSTTIIQFCCPDIETTEKLKLKMVNQLNIWSDLGRLADDPDYVTSPYTMNDWCAHLTTPDLWWVNWDAIYPHLGNSGQAIADQMFGFGELQGIARLGPLVEHMPDVRLQVIEVDDLVAAGYLPEPEDPVA